jgi:hypothetical protein
MMHFAHGKVPPLARPTPTPPALASSLESRVSPTEKGVRAHRNPRIQTITYTYSGTSAPRNNSQSLPDFPLGMKCGTEPSSLSDDVTDLAAS